MSIIDEQADTAASTSELSEELIFLIAAVSTDTQRKRAIDLFRRFARQLGAEAYRRGQDDILRSMHSVPVTTDSMVLESLAPESLAPKGIAPDHRVSIIPPINWQE